METTTTHESFHATDHQVSPQRRVIASFTTYREAQRIVDYLADQEFPVDHIAIVTEGLHFVERVTGRLSWGKAIMSGVVSGATIGLFLGFLLGLFFIAAPLVTALVFALYGLLVGSVLGALMGFISYALSSGDRDFTSVGALQANRYDVVADETVANEAIHLLETRSEAVLGGNHRR